MKKVFIAVFAIALFLFALGTEVFADIGPKPTLDVVVKNLNTDVYYMDLLSNNGSVSYDDFNSSKYPASYKELPIYKYNVDGWLATNIRDSLLFGELKTVTNGQTDISHRYTYFGVPKVFKVIIQLESGQLYVSANQYDFTEFNQVTTIDFGKDMVLVNGLGDGLKLSGYVKPEINCSNTSASALNQEIKVEVSGTNLSGITNEKGYFEIVGINKNAAGYKLKISKPGYLLRQIETAALNADMVINGETTPIDIWAGDISTEGSQDGAINLSDIITAAKSFNSVSGDSRYVKDYDYNLDGAVNFSDIMIIAKHFNKISNDYPICSVPLPTPTPVLTPVPTKLVLGSGRVEAENMAFNGYTEDSYDGVSCAKLNTNIGTVSYTFNGDYGIYDVNIRYFDEKSGQSTMGLYIHNVRVDGPWVLDADDNSWKVKTIKGVLLKNGDPILLQGDKNGDECARVDYIETVLTSQPTTTPVPPLITVRGTVVWNDFEGGFYGLIADSGARYDISFGLKDVNYGIGSYIEITGYEHNWATFHMWGIPFEVVSYRILSITPTPTPTPTLRTTPTSTPTPALITGKGTLVWNDFEGGFYGVIINGIIRYDIGNALPGKGTYAGAEIEIKGYAHPDWMSTHQWGTPFELVSYQLFVSNTTPRPTPTPTPALITIRGTIVYNNLEGGFYGIISDNGTKYEIVSGFNGIESSLLGTEQFVIVGYANPGIVSIYQWGTPFKIISYTSPNGPKPT